MFSDAFWIKPPLCFLSSKQRDNSIMVTPDLFAILEFAEFQSTKLKVFGCRSSQAPITRNDCNLLDFEVELPINESVTGLVMCGRGQLPGGAIAPTAIVIDSGLSTVIASAPCDFQPLVRPHRACSSARKNSISLGIGGSAIPRLRRLSGIGA